MTIILISLLRLLLGWEKKRRKTKEKERKKFCSQIHMMFVNYGYIANVTHYRASQIRDIVLIPLDIFGSQKHKNNHVKTVL